MFWPHCWWYEGTILIASPIVSYALDYMLKNNMMRILAWIMIVELIINRTKVDQIEWPIDRQGLWSAKWSCPSEQTGTKKVKSVCCKVSPVLQQYKCTLLLVGAMNFGAVHTQTIHWVERCGCVKCQAYVNITHCAHEHLVTKRNLSLTHFEAKLEIEMQCLPTANVGSGPKRSTSNTSSRTKHEFQQETEQNSSSFKGGVMFQK